MRESKEPTKSDLSKIDALPERHIDYSDIPELTDDFWENARLAKPPKKRALTVRYDTEIIDYFKSHIGQGYQSKMNAILKAYIEYEKRHDAK